MAKLTSGEILRVVNNYIGVDCGYLGDFTYRAHAEFYPMYCDLDIDPYQYQGTTRERFIEILSSQSAQDQAKILRGVLERFPLDSDNAPNTRNAQEKNKIQLYIERLELNASAVALSIQHTSETVNQAISDAEVLMESNGAASAVDRMHTAIHGYLKGLCDDWKIEYGEDPSLTKVFKLLRAEHPAFYAEGPRQQDIKKILNGLATALDGLNTIRNQASLSHPKDALLGEAEANLAVNATRSILSFVEDKIQNFYKELDSVMDHSTVNDTSFDNTSPSSVDDIPF